MPQRYDTRRGRGLVDTAAANHSWVILVFHDIETKTSDTYACLPTLLQGIVNYVKQKGIPVVTNDQGRAQLP